MKNKKDGIERNAVEDHDGILTIRGGGARRDWNGIIINKGCLRKMWELQSFPPILPLFHQVV